MDKSDNRDHSLRGRETQGRPRGARRGLFCFLGNNVTKGGGLTAGELLALVTNPGMDGSGGVLGPRTSLGRGVGDGHMGR